MKHSFIVCLLLVSSFQSFSQVNLNSGLMAYYPFSGNANDASGNGNNPIFNNATLTNDRFGNPNSAYSFNGIDNYIRIPNSSSLNSSNQISICAWVKVAGFYQGTCHGNEVVMKGNQDYQTGDYKIRFDDSYFTNSQNCSINNPDVTHESFFGINSSSSSNAPFIQTNQWYSVVYTCDGTTARIYVNCQLAGSGPANGITFTNSDDLFLGALNNTQYPYWFNGVMDEVRIYNRAINEDEIKAYGDCSTPTFACDNWLSTPSVPSSVRIGQLNIPGHEVTVEAVINRTAPYSGGQVWAGDVVSKHRDPTDANYLLRPNSGEITTTTGYYKTPDIADIQLNQTYHIAMVYDGDSLKFYRNGCLMSEIKATGDLIQNSWETSIGFYSPEMYPNENFIGYINEVRIWNVARTQAQLQTYMNSSLPNPTSQTGLLAYYTFDNLINKQGNPSWNGTLNGSASINKTNPSCNAIVNQCKIACNLSITKSADTSICESSSLSLFASGGATYSWTPAATLDNPASATPIASPAKTTTYSVKVDDGKGCSKTDSVKVTVNPMPIISKSNDTSICVNSTVPLYATGGSSYSWTPASSLNNSKISNPDATPTTTTKYFVTVLNSSGCKKQDSVNVIVNALPVVSKSNDTTICLNSSAALFAKGGVSYSWSPGSSLSDSTIANPVAAPKSPTSYNVVVTNGAGCSKTATVMVNLKPRPSISISNDTTICNNSSIKIFAAGGSSYQWTPTSSLNNPAIATPIASPALTTNYHVSITDNNSCVYSDSVKISVLDTTAFSVSADNAVCKNDSKQLNATGGDSYEWTPATFLDNPYISNPTATPDSTIHYAVIIKDNTCKRTDTLFAAVTVLPSPNVTATHANDIDCSLSSSQLNAAGAASYTWGPETGLDNFGIANPVASPTTTTVYTVTGTDQNGCSNFDTVTVKVNYSGNAIYGLPDAFTPNGDGLNDCFGVKNWGQVRQLDFRIYNRFGQLIFKTDNPNNCWDGTYKGDPQQADVFVYTIKAKAACGNIDKKGTVTLLR